MGPKLRVRGGTRRRGLRFPAPRRSVRTRGGHRPRAARVRHRDGRGRHAARCDGRALALVVVLSPRSTGALRGGAGVSALANGITESSSRRRHDAFQAHILRLWGTVWTSRSGSEGNTRREHDDSRAVNRDRPRDGPVEGVRRHGGGLGGDASARRATRAGTRGGESPGGGARGRGGVGKLQSDGLRRARGESGVSVA